MLLKSNFELSISMHFEVQFSVRLCELSQILIDRAIQDIKARMIPSLKLAKELFGNFGPITSLAFSTTGYYY